MIISARFQLVSISRSHADDCMYIDIERQWIVKDQLSIMAFHIWWPRSCIILPPSFFLAFLTLVSVEDYVSVDTLLTFEANTVESCVDITIVDDKALEQVESFIVTLERPPDLHDRITLNPTQGKISITDDDGEFKITINIPLLSVLCTCIGMIILLWHGLYVSTVYTLNDGIC